MFLKNRNISSKIKRSKVTDYAALNVHHLSDIQHESGEGVDKLPKDVGSDCFTHAPDLNNLKVDW